MLGLAAGIATAQEFPSKPVRIMTGGVVPEGADTIVMHYTGMTIDGKKFESSLDRGQPLVYPFSSVRSRIVLFMENS